MGLEADREGRYGAEGGAGSPQPSSAPRAVVPAPKERVRGVSAREEPVAVCEWGKSPRAELLWES